MKLSKVLIAIGLFATFAGAGGSPAAGGRDQAKKEYICPACGCASDSRIFEQPGKCPDCGMTLSERNDTFSIGETGPDFSATDQFGKKFKLAGFRGKVIVLDFWEHW